MFSLICVWINGWVNNRETGDLRRHRGHYNVYVMLLAILWVEHTIPLKQLSIADFAIVAKGALFWLSIVTSPQLICDATRTWGTGIVTSYSPIVPARAN